GDVAALAESMQAVGLLNPVVLTQDNRLVSGLHRVEAANKLSWKTIDCRKVDLSDPHVELAEIDENLIRNELTALERAEHLARRKELYKALYPAPRHGGDRKSEQAKDTTNQNGIIPFCSDAAQKIGTSRSTIEQEIKIAKSIPESIKNEL